MFQLKDESLHALYCNTTTVMEERRSTRYPLRGRVQVALPNQTILSGHTVDISVEGICIVLQIQIPEGLVCPIRFEMTINGKDHVITALAKSIYCVLAGRDGFRVGIAFKDDNPQRTTLIRSLAAKKPIAAASRNEPPNQASGESVH